MIAKKQMSRLKVAAALAVPTIAVCNLSVPQARAADWVDPVSGSWLDGTKWSTGVAPTTAADTGILSAAGTYTVQFNMQTGQQAGGAIIGNAASGVQTANVVGPTNSGAINITIGNNGILRQSDVNLGGPAIAGAGVITIQNGGRYELLKRNPGNHNVDIQAGGVWEILTDLTTVTTSTSALSANTTVSIANTGQISGAGNLSFGGNGMRVDGTGTIGGTGMLLGDASTSRGVTWGSVTVNRNWQDNLNAVHLVPGAVLTINGEYTATRSTSGGTTPQFATSVADTNATISGSGNITYANATTSTNPFGGDSTGTNGSFGGDLTFDGSGTLTINNTNTGILRIMSSNLNLKRDTVFAATSTGVFELHSATTTLGTKVNVTGNGTTLTVASGTVVRAADQGRRLTANGGGEIFLAGATLEGNSNATDWNLRIGQTTAGALTLGAGTTNTFRRYTTNANRYYAYLDANATVNVGANSILKLTETNLRVDITSTAGWGFRDGGDIRITSNNVFLEALGNNNGDGNKNTNFVEEQALHIDRLSFESASSIVLNLWENANNDGGAADTAIYVNTLDVTGMAAGQTIDVAGLAGAEKLYYRTLVGNAAVIAGNADIVFVPEPASLALLTLGAGGLLRRRKRI